MYLYFFDLDDTICNTAAVMKQLGNKYNIKREDFQSQEDYFKVIDVKLMEYGLDNINPLENSTVALLQQLMKTNSQDIFYITARESSVRDVSTAWLKKHNLWLGEEKLIMDTKDIKGKTINNIMNNSDKKFALFFDDLVENHKEASFYKEIICCYPY
ncbi:MAG: hypothetical protein LBH40_06170 [Alphaproteobacteria bacterium]|jgi:uncharacterized HAD superfamily protein|nr:hypothetical protein [Alphaproteobacteria bacterium]